MIRRLATLSILALLASSARADDPEPAAPPAGARPAAEPTHEEAADAVLAAVRAKDEARLRSLAGPRPNPWLVADELLARGEADAAEAFARAATGKDVAALPGFVASRRGKAVDRAARAAAYAALARVGAAVKQGDAATASSVLDGVRTPPNDPIAAIRIGGARADALRGLSRLAESGVAFLAVAKEARTLGWLEYAGAAYQAAAAVAHARSDLRGALAALEGELEVAQAGGMPAHVASVLGNIGVVHESLGDYPHALEFQERSLAMAQGLGARGIVAAALRNIGEIRQAMGEFARAIESYERARKLCEELGDRKGVSVTLVGLGTTYLALGDSSRALEFQERALKIDEETGDREGVGVVLATIGNIHMTRGDYSKALQLFERSRETLEKFGRPSQVAALLTNMGSLYCNLADFPRALEFEERALRLTTEMGNRAGAAVTLGNMGIIHMALQDYPRALAAQERALKLKEEIGDRAGVAATLMNLGVVHDRLGDPARALEITERALRLHEEVGDRSGAAQARVNIGNFMRARGDFARALEFQERALAEAEALGVQEVILKAVLSLAHTHLENGGAARAVALARRGVDVLGRLGSGLAEEQGARAREQFLDVFEYGLRAALDAGDTAAAAHFLESARAATLLESLGGRDALRAVAIPEALRAEEARARAAEALAAKRSLAALAGGNLRAIQESRKALEAAQASVGEAIGRIQRQAKAGASVLYPEADTIEEIRKRVGSQEALVLYGFLSEEALALVATRDGARVVRLGKDKPIEEACAAKDWASVRALVVDPLGLPETTRRLLLSPSGALSYVPFCALLPDTEIAYVPSGTAYGVLLDDQDKHGEGVLALGDPDYEVKSDSMAGAVALRGGLTLVRLPATGEEAKAVGTVTLLGRDVTEQGLRDGLAKKPRWRAVHLACHGLFNLERPMFSSLALTPAGEDDGFLSALEVFGMKVPADLAVLSACETGKGKVYKAEGIVGLTRAFMFAGAPRVLVSLWKVDDEATRALMVKFYELWNPRDGKPGLPTAEALHKAQEFVRSQPKWEHPHFWAAWVLWGLPQ